MTQKSGKALLKLPDYLLLVSSGTSGLKVSSLRGRGKAKKQQRHIFVFLPDVIGHVHPRRIGLPYLCSMEYIWKDVPSYKLTIYAGKKKEIQNRQLTEN